MRRVWLLILWSTLSVSCSPASESPGALYAAECDALLNKHADPEVFAGSDQPGSHGELAAIAFEQETATWSSGMKDGRRPDFELLVGYDDESDGYECEVIGVGGYVVASALAYGPNSPDVYVMRRDSKKRFAFMVGVNGAVPEPRFFIDVEPDSDSIKRIYPTESGDVAVPGLTVTRSEDGNLEVCDQRRGFLRKLDPRGATVETIEHGCENQEATEVYGPAPPGLIRYDGGGNTIEMFFNDEAGRPGRVEFRNVLDDRGNWTRRLFMMKTADSPEFVRIREEYRYIRYNPAHRLKS